MSTALDHLDPGPWHVVRSSGHIVAGTSRISNRRYPAELATLDPALALPDLGLLVERLGQERERVRRLGGDVPLLTTKQARAMTQAELERAIDALRAQASVLAA